MGRAISRTLCAGIAVCALVAACGGPPPTPRGPLARWRLPDDARGSRPFDLSRRDFGALTLPQARHAGEDVDDSDGIERSRFIVNVTRDSIVFKQTVWSLTRDRAQGLENLRRAVLRVVNQRPPRPWLLIRADSAVSWSNLRAILQTLLAPDTAPAMWQFATLTPDPRAPWVDAAMRLGVTAADEPGNAVSDLALDVGPDGAVRAVRGTRTWAFAAGDPFSDPGRLDLANRNWDEIEAALALDRGVGDARALPYAITDDVPWAYVVAAWDCGIGAGFRDFDLAGAGLRLRFEPPLPFRHVSLPGERDPRDWSPAFALVLGALVACALGGLAFWAGAKRPRRRRA